jgi:outer membrane protein TolC
MRKIIIFIVLFSCPLWAKGGAVFSEYGLLNGYIQDALGNNLALQQKQFDHQMSKAALDEARGLFLPSLSINARYSRAGGGRTIDLPLGDLMNPVYGSLNEIFTALGNDPKPFPNLENQKINFLREEEHETKIRLVQPVFQPGIYFNYKIHEKQLQISNLTRLIYSRSLIKEVKISYYKILETEALLKLLSSTMNLLTENKKITGKLFDNNMATKEAIYRSHAELLSLKQQKMDVRRKNKIAKQYFNFLLNRPLESEIEIENVVSLHENHILEVEEQQTNAIRRREELKQLEYAIEIQKDQVQLNAASFLPTLNVVVDYGYEGQKYELNDNHDFWMASGVLEWNLLNGFRDQSKKEKAALAINKLELQALELKRKIQLQVQSAIDDIQNLKGLLLVSIERAKSEHESYRIINQKYQNGQAAMIEYLDAQNNLLDAKTKETLAHYHILKAAADLEVITAAIQFQ